MSHTMESVGRGMFPSDASFSGPGHVPILPSSAPSAAYSQSEAMDITPPASASLAPLQNPDSERASEMPKSKTGNKQNAPDTSPSSNGMQAASSSPATGQQPKVVQTAFIHKLYSMLEDQSIKHLISWSDSAESFVMSPSPEFSKVLAQYFKHTNISSFVRQLNMYGFHKVSDVFHTGQPESALWEFKHGNGNFKRGDVAGLREIKRRASRHALIQRTDAFASPHKPSISQPGTPAEPVPELPTEARLANVEAALFDVHARLMRTEESNTALSTKCAILNESLMKYHQWSTDLAQAVTKLIPDHENHLFNQVTAIHKDMLRHAEMLQRTEDGHDPLMSGRPYFSNLSLEAGSLSPRQRAQDERRGSFQTLPGKGFFRAPAPPHLAISPRRFGSIGAQGQSPSYRAPLPAQQPVPPAPHPLTSVEPNVGLARRHTSADIRDTAGWPPQVNSLAEGAPAAASGAANWPPSPQTSAVVHADPSIQSVLASYSLGGPRQSISGPQSRQASPPPPESVAPVGENGFQFRTPNYGARFYDSSVPPTRRGSIAHLLNVSEGTDVQHHEDDGNNDDRKRKRL